ncbi:50S ribosomal protein L4 [Candidatus Woesearchaeota archaeon]|nr:50S ribosomal protein L4 [Candidatus Woesearchaeota archaeon]MBW3016567.1 50S ribosomal protein L4 [Candidatus Woesearchaeota archaeon]
MELKIIDKTNKEAGKQKLPAQFQEEIRPDLIKRAAEAVQSHKRQSYGADPRAGKKQAAKLSRRRRKYKGAYGKGISRMPRKTLTRRGMQMIWVGAFAPGNVGGRRAFPPTSQHNLAQKINDKERKKAIRSALAATLDKETVKQRGHKAPQNYPFIISTDIEKIEKTSELLKILETIGLKEELQRNKRKVRAGKGTMRGRKYKRAKGPLIVVSENCSALKAAKSIPGIDATEITKINAELLAPGTHAGRLTLFTQAAIQKLDKEKLFI